MPLFASKQPGREKQNVSATARSPVSSRDPASDLLHLTPLNILRLQRSIGNRAVARLLQRQSHQPVADIHATNSPTLQRVVKAGLRQGTRVYSSQESAVGTILEEDTNRQSYFVEFIKPEMESVVWIPYTGLDLDDDSSIDEEGGEEGFTGKLFSLPGNITLKGINYQWEEGGAFILKPTDARGYPHITFIRDSGSSRDDPDLSKVHFTSAEFIPRQNVVSIIRRGYQWNGMQSKLVDDFPDNQQLLPVKQNDGATVTFDLTGGRKNQSLQIGKTHSPSPSASELARALNIPG